MAQAGVKLRTALAAAAATAHQVSATHSAQLATASTSLGDAEPAQPSNEILWAAAVASVGSASARVSASLAASSVAAGSTQPAVAEVVKERVEWWRREPVSYSAEMYRLVPSFLNLDNPLGDVIDHHYEYEILPNGKKIPAKPRTIPYPQR